MFKKIEESLRMMRSETKDIKTPIQTTRIKNTISKY